MTQTRRHHLLALAILLIWAGFGQLRFDQGLDLGGQGLWVYGSSVEASGHAVHSVVNTADGPLAYQILGSWMRIGGESYRAAAQVQTALHALVAVLLALWLAPLGILAVLMSQLVLLAGAPLPFGALWAALTLLIPPRLPSRTRPDLVAGLFLSGLITTDALWFIVALVIFAANRPAPDRMRSCRAAGVGFLAGFGLFTAHALASGAIAATLRNGLVGPWASLGGELDIGRMFLTLRSGAWLHTPFAGLATGESMGPAWPAHELLRATGARVGGVLVLVSPFLLARHARPLWRPATGLALAGLILGLGRGNLPTLTLATGLTAVAWLVEAHRGQSFQRKGLALLMIALLVPVAENAWLVLHSGRPDLVRWDSPHAGVRLAARRAASLGQAISRLHFAPDQPVLIWPDLTGLHVLLGTRPAVPPPGPDRATGKDSRIAKLLGSPEAPPVLFAPSPALLPQNLERTLPLTATSLRRNYRLRGALAAGGLNLRAIEPGVRASDPLASRLPRVECMVAAPAQQLTPALRDELALGQSFRIEEDDFEGFAIRLVTGADSVPVKLRARIWERPGTEFNSLLDAMTLTLVASHSTPMHWVPFPVTDTAGRDLALVIECMGTPDADVRLAWHENATEDDLGDVYPYGSALLDFTEVDADLIILIY